jgi:hypothetical protein
VKGVGNLGVNYNCLKFEKKKKKNNLDVHLRRSNMYNFSLFFFFFFFFFELGIYLSK